MKNSNSSLSLTGLEQERVDRTQDLTSKGTGSVSELIEMLTDPSWVVRRAVVLSLSQLGAAAVEALCSVIETRRESEARLAAAVDALVATTTAAEPYILKLAHHPDPAIVADAVQILGRRRTQASIPTLVELTKHANDNVAVGAIEALGRVGGRAAVEALIETVGTGNFFRTFPAIDVLGRSGDPRSIAPLTLLLSNPNYLPEASRALGRSGEKSAVKPLIELFKSQSDSVIRVAATSLWDLRERFEEKSGGNSADIDAMIRAQIPAESVRRLGRVLSNADVQEGVALCRLLGAIGDLEAAMLLTAALDGPPLVAECAAESLKGIGKNADDHLLQAIREGDSARRKILLPIITRSVAAHEVARCLIDSDPEVRSIACDTLARIGNGSVVANIFTLLTDSNPRVVHSATSAIQALGTREARDLAAQASKSESPVVRRSALRILGYFGDSGSLQPMLDGLNDPDARVKEAALQGLPYLEDPRALEALVAETKNLVARTRGLAMRSLGQVPNANERVYSLLLRGSKDPDAWVRYYSCQSLGRLGYADAAPEIAALFQDEAGQVRVSAVEALSDLKSTAAHTALRDAAASDDIDVRRAALVGLGISHRSEDLQLILSAAASKDVPTRLIALSALSNFASPLVLAALSSAASDPDEQLRSAAIGFLSARPEQDATEVLIALLGSPTTEARAKAALMIPSQTRIAGLLAGLQLANDELAAVLISVLSRIDRREVRGALLAAIKLENVAARKAAAPALASRRDSEMSDALRESAENDPDPAVRSICVLLLKD